MKSQAYTPTVAELEALSVNNPYHRTESVVWCDTTFDIYAGPDGRKWKIVRGGWGGNKGEKACLV